MLIAHENNRKFSLENQRTVRYSPMVAPRRWKGILNCETMTFGVRFFEQAQLAKIKQGLNIYVILLEKNSRGVTPYLLNNRLI